MSLPCALLITCEHATNAVPAELTPLFAGKAALLHSHRGWDAGALELARAWAARWHAPLLAAEVSRLVCDANRAPHNPAVWSECTRTLAPARRAALLARWHSPHRRAVADAVRRLNAAGLPVLHLAAHSFTPVLNGVTRSMDIGLLYAPRRPQEALLARRWQAALRPMLPAVRRNAPYRGAADGLPTFLRRLFPAECYCGFEVECNQRLLEHGPFPAAVLGDTLEEALRHAPIFLPAAATTP